MKTINIRNEEEWRGNPFLEDAVYGGIDTMATYATDAAQTDMIQPHQALVHDFNMAMQPATLLCTLRGTAVDHARGANFRGTYARNIQRVQKYISAMTQQELGWPLHQRITDYGALDLIDAFFGVADPSSCKLCGGKGRIITQPYVAPVPMLNDAGEEVRWKSGARKGEMKMVGEKKERSKKCPHRHTHPGFGLKKPALAWDAKTNQPSIDKRILGGIAKKHAEEPAGRLARAILLFRKLKKLADTARAMANAPDGRFHPHFAMGNTASHRMASKKSNLGWNTNGQNITKQLRRLLVADPGYTLLQGDLARAESHILAAKAQDTAYLDAHEGEEDTHTLVAKMCWPSRDWPNTPREDFLFAKSTKFDPSIPRGTLRDVSKVVQHAIGRDGTKRTVGQALGTGDLKGQEVIDVYYRAFPNVKRYIERMRARLKQSSIVECEELGIKRKFFANPHHSDTLRDVLAFVLQAPVAYVCHIAFWRVYRHLDTKSLYPGKGNVQLLLHNHDAVIVQVRTSEVERYLPLLDEMFTVPLTIHGREVVLRRDWEMGKNWRDMKGVSL